MKNDRIFTVKELNAALGFDWAVAEMLESDVQFWWTRTSSEFWVGALKLKVLPGGWKKSSFGTDCDYFHPDGIFLFVPKNGFNGAIRADEWSEVVDTYQYTMAGRLLAACCIVLKDPFRSLQTRVIQTEGK